MATVYRSELIDLLERLGARSDEEVLKSAQSLHQMVTDAGILWTDLVRPDLEFDSDAAPSANDNEQEPETSAPSEQAGPRIAANAGDDRKTLDSLIASKTISSNLRQELKDLKRDLADNEFTAMDSDYVRALAERLKTKAGR